MSTSNSTTDGDDEEKRLGDERGAVSKHIYCIVHNVYVNSTEYFSPLSSKKYVVFLEHELLKRQKIAASRFLPRLAMWSCYMR